MSYLPPPPDHPQTVQVIGAAAAPGASVPPATTVLVVHTDRLAVHRWHRGLVLIHVLLTLGILALIAVIAAITSGAGVSPALSLLPFLILLAGQVFQIGYHCYLWGARAAVLIPAVVTTAGLHLYVPQGEVFLPWDAVASLSIRSTAFGRVLSVHPQPGVRIDSPGVTIPLGARSWSVVLRRGLLLGERGLCEGLDHLVVAIHTASAGRVTVR